MPNARVAWTGRTQKLDDVEETVPQSCARRRASLIPSLSRETVWANKPEIVNTLKIVMDSSRRIKGI
jgi:hypothetical protein